ncbi:hypothetical protein Gotur_017595 [Gossypium turneri]
MGFPSEVYMDLGSPTSIASFCDVVLQRSISIGIRASHHVSQLQLCGASGDASIAVNITTIPTMHISMYLQEESTQLFKARI